ncbi:MAG: phage major capsid protein [Candidatus Anammoxibacter sp.]
MKLETKKLREERSELVTEARLIAELAEKEEKELSADDSQKIDDLLEKSLELEKTISRNDRINTLSTEQEEKLLEEAEDNKNTPDEEKDNVKAYHDAFWKYQKVGVKGMKQEELELLSTRAQQTTTDTAGGFLIEPEFSKKLEIALLEFGGMREVAEIFTTSTGVTIPYPTVNSTSNKGEWLTEGSAVAEKDEVFASTDFEAWTASSKLVKVSRQLLQDSFFDLPSFLLDRLVERIGRLTNEDYTTGSGSSQPHGVITDAATGKTAASATAITMNEMFDLKHSVDPAYRKNGRWMFNDTTLKVLSQLKDSDGRYLWQPNVQEGTASLLLGHPYTINSEIADIGASNKPVAFGDFKKYKIRDVLGFTLLRLEELYAAKLEVGFIGFLRTDGKLLDAGTNPIKLLVNAAS